MKIIDIIQVDEGLWSAARNTLRDAGSWGMEKIAAAFGRGNTWRKAEVIAPEIAALEARGGPVLTRDQIEKHIIDTDPAVRNALDEAVRMKQAYIDNQYAINPTAARQVFGSAQAPVARLTQQEQDILLSKPEFKPSAKLVKEVESKVAEITSVQRRAAARAALAPIAKWTDTLVGLGFNAALAAMIIAPFTEYYVKLNRAKEIYDSGQMPKKGVPESIKTIDAWFIWYTDLALGDAVLKSGTIYLVNKHLLKRPKEILIKMGEKLLGPFGARVGELAGKGAAAWAISTQFDENANKWWGSLFANFLGWSPISPSAEIGGMITTRISDPMQAASSLVMYGVSELAAWYRELLGLNVGSDTFADKANGKETPAVKKPAGQPETTPAATGTVTTPGGATVSGDWN